MPALQLYTGPDRSSPRSDRPVEFWTIRETFEGIALPRLRRLQRSESSIAKWRKAVEYWELIRTDNPPIGAIAADDLSAFPDLLLGYRPPLKITTTTAANQQLTYIAGILRTAADHLPRVPRGDKLPRQAPTRHRRIIKMGDLSDIYHNCKFANFCLDDRIPAPLVWRSLIVAAITAGPRRNELVTMPASAWYRASEFPELPGLDIDADSPHGWLVYHTPKTSRRKGGLPLIVPVSDVLADHLRELDRLAPRRSRMFPLGDHPSTWRKHLNRIQRKAGIDPPFTWQDFRKTSNRIFRRAANREVAAFMLGHQPRGVNATYYDDLTEDAVEAVSKIELPAAFSSLRPTTV